MDAGIASTSGRRPAARSQVQIPSALFGTKAKPEGTKGKKASKTALPPKQKGPSFLTQFTDAIDFSEVRSKSDAKLLYEAKYGKRENGKMTREQYGALRRKIGGTSKDYFKEWVEVKGDYTDKGYVAESTGLPPAFPFLLATVLGLVAALGYVVSQTS